VRILPTRSLVAGVSAAAALLVGAAGTAHVVMDEGPHTAGKIVAALSRQEPAAFLPLTTPRSFKLKVHGQYQTTDYYCVPASSAMSLSTFGVKVSQFTLAKKMKTTVKGTGGSNASRVMDDYIHPRRFDDKLVGDVARHPAVLMERVAYDVGTLHRAPVIQVWMEQLPWNKGKVKGKAIGHAIIAYGYNRQAGTITVFDPWRPTGGSHTLAAAALAGSLQTDAGMHYISRL
jgi:hypothetical protein